MQEHVATAGDGDVAPPVITRTSRHSSQNQNPHTSIGRRPGLVFPPLTSRHVVVNNHNSTTGKWFYMYAGASGTLYSFVLPGQDDEAIAYHSSGGVSGSSGASFCNPSEIGRAHV